jgi:alpha-1,6-mannosyltransferase
MIDRVTQAVGRLGPVGDAEAMAANILDILYSGTANMVEAARTHALQFSWDSSMEALFGRLYPAAMAKRAERTDLSTAAAPLAA